MLFFYHRSASSPRDHDTTAPVKRTHRHCSSSSFLAWPWIHEAGASLPGTQARREHGKQTRRSPCQLSLSGCGDGNAGVPSCCTSVIQAQQRGDHSLQRLDDAIGPHAAPLRVGLWPRWLSRPFSDGAETKRQTGVGRTDYRVIAISGSGSRQGLLVVQVFVMPSGFGNSCVNDGATCPGGSARKGELARIARIRRSRNPSTRW
jgi:hypothetical protein